MPWASIPPHHDRVAPPRVDPAVEETGQVVIIAKGCKEAGNLTQREASVLRRDGVHLPEYVLESQYSFLVLAIAHMQLTFAVRVK